MQGGGFVCLIQIHELRRKSRSIHGFVVLHAVDLVLPSRGGCLHWQGRILMDLNSFDTCCEFGA